MEFDFRFRWLRKDIRLSSSIASRSHDKGSEAESHVDWRIRAPIDLGILSAQKTRTVDHLRPVCMECQIVVVVCEDNRRNIALKTSAQKARDTITKADAETVTYATMFTC